MFADVDLIDVDSDLSVPLRQLTWYSLGAAEETMALHPAEPLKPQHRYRIEATPIDFDGDGAERVPFVTSFETSSMLLEPLVLSGQIELSLRGADVDVMDCGPCGASCVSTGKRRALVADVQLPAPSGGQGLYRAVVHFTDHTPVRPSTRDPGGVESPDIDHDVDISHFLKLDAGEALTLEQEVFDESAAYAGCFTFVVWDPAGHVAHTAACLPSLSGADIRALASDDGPLPLAPDEATASEQVEDAAADRADSASSLSCAFGGPTRSTSGGAALLLAAWLVRRRLTRRR